MSNYEATVTIEQDGVRVTVSGPADVIRDYLETAKIYPAKEANDESRQPEAPETRIQQETPAFRKLPQKPHWTQLRPVEERKAHARMMHEAKIRKLSALPADFQDGPRHVYFNTGALNIAATVRTLGVGDDIVLPLKAWEAAKREAASQGWDLQHRSLSNGGIRVERVS